MARGGGRANTDNTNQNAAIQTANNQAGRPTDGLTHARKQKKGRTIQSISEGQGREQGNGRIQTHSQTCRESKTHTEGKHASGQIDQQTHTRANIQTQNMHATKSERQGKRREQDNGKQTEIHTAKQATGRPTDGHTHTQT